MVLSLPIVEVRVPTYNRADLLSRALMALVNQTYKNWRAIILDDGDSARTQSTIGDIGDSRILHRPNRERLGASRNIGRAFSTQPMADGEFFYVLEDDNLINPSFIEDNLKLLKTHDVGLVVNNQWVEFPSGTSSPAHGDWTTIDSFTEGVWAADDFKIAMLWKAPISNGSIFWRKKCLSDFTIDDISNPALHEWLRAYRLKDAVYFNEAPNAFWRQPDKLSSSLSSAMGRRFNFLRVERATQAMRRNVLSTLQNHGEMSKLLSERFKTPLVVREEAVLRACGRWPGASNLTFARRAELRAKALLLRGLVPIPSF